MCTPKFTRLAAIALAALLSLPAAAAENTPPTNTTPANGLTAIPDPELATMRGRYTVGSNAVAWFGVSMISTWQTASGQTLQGTMSLGMDFSAPGAPKITFTPSVSITAENAPMPTVANGGLRSVDSSGLANVSGMTQSVQVAGDNNLAGNVTQLNVSDGSAVPVSVTGTHSVAGGMTTQQGDAVATAGFDGNAAQVMLQIDGQGAVQQWIRNGSLGQSIQLTSDGQQVSNRLELDLVRQSLASNTQLTQNVAQAIGMTRGLGF